MKFFRTGLGWALGLALGTANSYAGDLHFVVKGVQGQILYETHESSTSEFVGNLSERVLRKALSSQALSEYNGSTSGVLSIQGLRREIEILSDYELKSYGWCFSVDGKVGDFLVDQHRLTGAEHEMVWFYAYARSYKNDWPEMCTPADHVPSHEDWF